MHQNLHEHYHHRHQYHRHHRNYYHHYHHYGVNLDANVNKTSLNTSKNLNL